MATSTRCEYTHKCDNCGFQELSTKPAPPSKWAEMSIRWNPDGGPGAAAGFEGRDLCQRCRRAVIESLHNVSNPE